MHLSHRASLATPGGELTGSTNRVLGHAGHRGGAPLSSGFRQHDHRPGQAGMVLSSHLLENTRAGPAELPHVGILQSGLPRSWLRSTRLSQEQAEQPATHKCLVTLNSSCPLTAEPGPLLPPVQRVTDGVRPASTREFPQGHWARHNRALGHLLQQHQVTKGPGSRKRRPLRRLSSSRHTHRDSDAAQSAEGRSIS